jgi:hypothetical protein
MSDKYPDQSPYSYVGNRPIMVIDPNGMNEWLPPTDGSNNWTAEAGDCAWTLHEDAGISFYQAKSSVGSMNAARGNGEGNLDVFVGDVVSVDKSNGYAWNSEATTDNNSETPTTSSSSIVNSSGTEISSSGFGLSAANTITLVLLADDASGIGAIDDVLIPFVYAVAFLYDNQPTYEMSRGKSGLQGEKQGVRDRGFSGYPAAFKKWAGHSQKVPGEPDFTPQEVKELYKQWLSEGKPELFK